MNSEDVKAFEEYIRRIGYNKSEEWLVRKGFEAALSHRDSQKPTEEMCAKARGFIMGLDLGIRTWGAMQKHLDMGGYETTYYIRDKAHTDYKGHITKWDVADCIYTLMTQSDKPPQKPEEN